MNHQVQRGDEDIARAESRALRAPSSFGCDHELKCLPTYFQAIVEGRMTFNVRLNDRGYRALDVVLLREWDEDSGYTGRVITREIGFVTSFQQQPGYVVFSLL